MVKRVDWGPHWDTIKKNNERTADYRLMIDEYLLIVQEEEEMRQKVNVVIRAHNVVRFVLVCVRTCTVLHQDRWIASSNERVVRDRKV